MAAALGTECDLGGADLQSLLPKLLKEGLTPSGNVEGQSRPGDLIQVLLEHCLLKPITSNRPVDSQQATYTIAIIKRQASLSSQFLVDPYQQAPFYQWLLPRLIYIASVQDATVPSREIVEIAAVLLRVLGKDLPDGEDTWAKGPSRVAQILSHVTSFCQDIIEGRKGKLYEFSGVISDCHTLLAIIAIVVQLDLPFSQPFVFVACNQLSQAFRLVNSTEAQLQYTQTVNLALDKGCFEGLAKACAFLGSVDIIESQAGNGMLKAFYQKVDRAHESIRYEVWWSLRRRARQLTVVDDCIGFPGICHLLNPIPPRLSADAIRHAIGDQLISDWVQQAQALSRETGDISKFNHLMRLQTGRTGSNSPARKRKRGGDNESVNDRLRQILPGIADAGDPVELLLQENSSLRPLAPEFAKLVCSMAGDHVHSPLPSLRTLKIDVLDVWLKVGVEDLSMMNALGAILEHAPPQAIASEFQLSRRRVIIDMIFKGLNMSERSKRVASGRNLSLLFAAQNNHIDQKIAERNRQSYIESLSAALQAPLTGETGILVLGDIGRQAEGEALCSILQLLLRQLGSPYAPLRSLAYTELIGLAKHHHKTPYTLLSPFLERISVLLADNLVRSPDMISETMHFIGSTRQNFLQTTLRYTLPALVVSRNREALQMVASITKNRLGLLLMDNISHIFAHIFLHPEQTKTSTAFLVNLIQNMTGAASQTITVTSLMTACMVDFIVMLVVELGDEEKAARRAARSGLNNAKEIQSSGKIDLGVFLKPYMLGVISQLNDMLHDVLGKKSVASKRKIIRSLGALIRLVGDSMASFSPQIMASLQSTLGIKELRQETLTTWATFTSTLKYADVGPFVGRTTGALVANWATFDDDAKYVAVKIINEIADNAKDLSQFIEEVVGMDHIPELRRAASLLTSHRKNRSIPNQISKILDRVASKNVAISTASMNELKLFMLSHQLDVLHLAKGDTFAPIMARLMSTLCSGATRDGDCSELRDLSYECMGILGALDPDRLGFPVESTTLTLGSNFADHQESINFALHLVRDLLVDAFRATNDTKHQTYLAYAIQELLKFCGFSLKVIHSAHQVDVRVRDRWQSLPKDQLETLTPLLESRFSLTEGPIRTFPHPIYSNVRTYREWLQRWSTDLIGKVMLMPDLDRAVADSKAIFGVFRGILRNQDVMVAHHILPHLVLTVLLSGTPAYSDEICLEIKTVLQDQLHPTGPADRRSLSAQVIFDLMDHLSKWLRMQRVDANGTDRGGKSKIIERVLSSIETHLMAHAALHSRAYARSLRSFEERIIQLRQVNTANTELQSDFERLHQIYAELDEPDGMEGVSAFVISPSLEHQIREHESTGRWTSAQSCWEVRLQQSPDDVTLHVGLLKCLRNLGHYDTLRTHIRGVISRRPDWSIELAPFAAEAAWIIGDWETVRQIGSDGPPIGRALLALHENTDLAPVLTRMRREVGSSITGKGYASMCEPLLQLHLAHEISMIYQVKLLTETTSKTNNWNTVTQEAARKLVASLDARFHTTSPTFRTREAVLSIRRTAYGLINSSTLNPEIGDAWILSSKIARKAGYEQTAYSATLQAKESGAPFAFVQQAKLRRVQGSVFKALTDLDNALTPLKNTAPGIDLADHVKLARGNQLAKAVLLGAKWATETDRFEENEIISRYTEAINLCDNLESPHYQLGHYYDSLPGNPAQIALYRYQTCHSYSLALRYGVKYIYQTMPRMLTLWLDMGQVKVSKRQSEVSFLKKIQRLMEDSSANLPAYQFYTAFPQIVSRIVNNDKDVFKILRLIMTRVIEKYPQQALWPMVGVMQSRREDRKRACKDVLERATGATAMIKDAQRFSSTLLKFADDKGEKEDEKKWARSIREHYSYVKKALPTKMILPLQDALTCSLPTSSDTIKSHNPFPYTPVEVASFDDRVDIMPSLQKPKKLVFIGDNGKRYPFLCKPHDDLRKDARLMDLNTMINKLLKSASESRRRQLYVRTYAVMPLNEECGLLEWVTNTHAFKNILEKGYHRQSKKIFYPEVVSAIDKNRHKGPDALAKAFKEVVLPRFQPSVFNEWFLSTWPEPSAWLASRLAYSRTLAVMSMIGYVLGLGDRHGENILFDGLSGDTVHVDLNCLFDKGKSFEVPELVPFRLTHNMVDALGVTGVEGVYRNAAEITMNILRINTDSLMSVLEAFVHDPLVEWTRLGRNKGETDIRDSADKNLQPIKRKLRGIANEGNVQSVPKQVEELIKDATSPAKLAAMYAGWAPWL